MVFPALHHIHLRYPTILWHHLDELVLGWTSAKLPEGAYDVIEKPVVTVSMGTSLGFHASVSDDVVFTIVEAVCEHPDRIQAVHPAALGFDPEQAYLGAGGPLHPGAEKYFRTKGWSA
jgi:uncharacterized protein